MSFNNYLQSLDELQEEAYGTSLLDISTFFLPDKEILKKLIKSKNPFMSEEDIDIIVEDTETLIKKGEDRLDEEENRLDEAENSLTTEELEQERERRKEELKKRIREEIEKIKEVYKEKLEQFKEEVKNLKREVREAIFVLTNKVKESAEALILAITKTATTLPGAIVMAVAPPWNIPAAITKVLLVIKAYLDLIAIVKMIVPYLEPTRKLPLLLSEGVLSTIGVTLKTSVITPMLAIFIPIKILSNIIKALFDFIKKLIGNAKKKGQPFRKATKRLIKLGHIEKTIGPNTGRQSYTNYPDDNSKIELSDGTPITVYSKDEDDIDEILGLLDQYEITNTSKWGGKSHVKGFRKQKVEFDDSGKVDEFAADFDINNMDGFIESLEGKINESESKFDFKLPEEIDEFIYNITLPDGTVIPNITEDGLEYYRNKFELRFDFDIQQ
jgi:hypothetical protein